MEYSTVSMCFGTRGKLPCGPYDTCLGSSFIKNFLFFSFLFILVNPCLSTVEASAVNLVQSHARREFVSPGPICLEISVILRECRLIPWSCSQVIMNLLYTRQARTLCRFAFYRNPAGSASFYLRVTVPGSWISIFWSVTFLIWNRKKKRKKETNKQTTVE